MDNCRIHHNPELVEMVNAAGMYGVIWSFSIGFQLISLLRTGCLLIYLPAYSPDLNPIEESFSTCEMSLLVCLFIY